MEDCLFKNKKHIQECVNAPITAVKWERRCSTKSLQHVIMGNILK